MGKLAVRALRAVLAVLLAGTVLVPALMAWALVSGTTRASPSSWAGSAWPSWESR